jgi:hypothetical protein
MDHWRPRVWTEPFCYPSIGYYNMLNPSFTRGEYWLLESVVEYGLQISLLDSPDLGMALNKPGHGMPRALLVETMRGLFERGLIIAHRSDDLFELSADQIEAALNEQRPKHLKHAHYYRLTEEGGRRWEAFARPDWDRYICEEYTPRDKQIEVAELVCTQRDLLERYLRMLQLNVYDIDEGSVQFDTVAPWNATYWKTLPAGHGVSFRCTQKEHMNLAEKPEYDRSWYRWR